MQAICSYCWLKHVKTLQEDGQELGGYFVWKQLENTRMLVKTSDFHQTFIHSFGTDWDSWTIPRSSSFSYYLLGESTMVLKLVLKLPCKSTFPISAIDPHRIAKDELRMTRQISTTNFAKNMAAKKQHTSYTHTFSPHIFMDVSKNQSVQAIQPIQPIQQLSRYKSWKRQAAAFRRSLVLLPQKQIPAPEVASSIFTSRSWICGSSRWIDMFNGYFCSG